MSGGSMDYLYFKVESADFRLTTPARRAFKTHLLNVARALRAIEWHDSGDGDDSEDEAIAKCLGPTATLEQAIEDAKVANAELHREILAAVEKAKGNRNG